MAAIGASDVTYTISQRVNGVASDKYKEYQVTMAFGDGAKTYPSGGVPLTQGSLGDFRKEVISLEIDDAMNSDGYLYKWDETNNKIRIYQAPSAVSLPLVELTTAATPAATTLKGVVRGR